jgi:hypothetical protein
MEIGVNWGLFWGKIRVEMRNLTWDIIVAYLGLFWWILGEGQNRVELGLLLLNYKVRIS